MSTPNLRAVDLHAIEAYARASIDATDRIIGAYSTSFNIASRLLRDPVRTHIRSLYGVVRIADEIVDGTARAHGLSTADVRAELDAYEASVLRALRSGYSTDPIIYAFAASGRELGWREDWVEAFFRSMRADIPTDIPTDTPPDTPHPTTPLADAGSAPATTDAETIFTAAQLEDYIYGSAGVIGLMCNAAFAAECTRRGTPWSAAERQRTDAAALALGSAFQKVNFLRDYAADVTGLGRRYLAPLAGEGPLDEAGKQRVVADIRADLARAREGIAALPPAARAGVRAAHDLFAELTDVLEATPASVIATQRVRVSWPRKLRVAAGALRQRGSRARG